jgi:hypothetical protein
LVPTYLPRYELTVALAPAANGLAALAQQGLLSQLLLLTFVRDATPAEAAGQVRRCPGGWPGLQSCWHQWHDSWLSWSEPDDCPC